MRQDLPDRPEWGRRLGTGLFLSSLCLWLTCFRCYDAYRVSTLAFIANDIVLLLWAMVLDGMAFNSWRHLMRLHAVCWKNGKMRRG